MKGGGGGGGTKISEGVHIFQHYVETICSGGSKYFEKYGPGGTILGGSKFVVTGSPE